MAKNNRVLERYSGSKGGAGVYQQIINQIRPHDVYLELFAGSGCVFMHKRPARINIINDIDIEVVEAWERSGLEAKIYQQDALNMISERSWNKMLKYCLYLDPPYPLGSRRSSKEIYNYEMTDDQHRELLELVKQLPPNVDVLISTYPNDLYADALAGWRCIRFTAPTHGGPATELLYMNYENDAGELHQYDYLGNDFTDRQRIRRKIANQVRKLQRLPPLERNAVLAAIREGVM